MSRTPSARARGYAVVNPGQAIFPPGAPVGTYPGAGATPTPSPTPTPTPANWLAYGSTPLVYGATPLRYGASA